MALTHGETMPTPIGVWITAGIAVAFGALSLWSGGRALFGGPALQAAVGDAVPFVLWFNFASGFAYVAAGIGIAMHKPWATLAALALAIAIVVVLIALAGFILRGGAYETRTLGAMVLRAGVWISIALYVRGQTSAQRTPT